MEGQYKVTIKFAGVEISKSPFMAGVKGMAGDASKVTVSGPGLEKKGVMVKQKTYFEVHTKSRDFFMIKYFVFNYNQIFCIYTKNKNIITVC